MIDKERLIQIVVEKHGILLSKDDPIFATVAINEGLLESYLTSVKAALAEHADIIQTQGELTSRQYEDVAEKLIGKSLLSLQKVIRSGVEDIQKCLPSGQLTQGNPESGGSGPGPFRVDLLWIALGAQGVIMLGLLVGIAYCVWRLS